MFETGSNIVRIGLDGKMQALMRKPSVVLYARGLVFCHQALRTMLDFIRTLAQLYRQAPNTNNLLSVSLVNKLASVVCTLFAVAMTILHVDCRSSGNQNLLLLGQQTRDGEDSVNNKVGWRSYCRSDEIHVGAFISLSTKEDTLSELVTS